MFSFTNIKCVFKICFAAVVLVLSTGMFFGREIIGTAEIQLRIPA